MRTKKTNNNNDNNNVRPSYSLEKVIYMLKPKVTRKWNLNPWNFKPNITNFIKYTTSNKHIYTYSVTVGSIHMLSYPLIFNK